MYKTTCALALLATSTIAADLQLQPVVEAHNAFNVNTADDPVQTAITDTDADPTSAVYCSPEGTTEDGTPCDPTAPIVPLFPAKTEEELEEERFQAISDIVYDIQQTWTGMHQGLYGVSMGTPKPDPECFAEWITDDMHFIYDYFRKFKDHEKFKTITYEDTTQLAYDMVDLIFLQDQYCHFRVAVYDVIKYCNLEE